MDDTLDCPECGGGMRLARRGPHPDNLKNHETQIFECVICGHEITREVGIDGKPKN